MNKVIWFCCKCGGENIQEQVWINMNNTSGKTHEDVVSEVEGNYSVYCEDCDDNTPIDSREEETKQKVFTMWERIVRWMRNDKMCGGEA